MMLNEQVEELFCHVIDVFVKEQVNRTMSKKISSMHSFLTYFSALPLFCEVSILRNLALHDE
jgi:hypothetical protein